jgi:hypothetical protein
MFPKRDPRAVQRCAALVRALGNARARITSSVLFPRALVSRGISLATCFFAFRFRLPQIKLDEYGVTVLVHDPSGLER